MEIWEPEGVFGDSRLIWMIIEGMESGVWMVVSGTIVFGACGLVRGCECCTCYKLSILVVRVSLAIFSRKNDNFSCIEDMEIQYVSNKKTSAKEHPQFWYSRIYILLLYSPFSIIVFLLKDVMRMFYILFAHELYV